MNRRIAFPFRILSDSAVEAAPWRIEVGDGVPAEAGDYLANWDRSTVVRLHRSLRVHFGIASADLGIPEEELSLSVVTRVGTGPGRLPRLIVRTDRREVRPNDAEVEILLREDGERLSTVLDLFTEVVLARVPNACDPLSPAQVGNRLWQDRTRTRLEGEEPRFPLEVVDLQAMLGDVTAAAAPWYLDWSPRDWNRDFYGAIRLYLNSGCEEIVQRVEARDPLTLQEIMGDAMSQVCERLLREPEPDAITGECEPGTLGAQAGKWLELAWPGSDREFARSLLLHKPSEFRATLIAVAESGEG